MKAEKKDPLLDMAPAYGVEALISMIDDREELIAAVKKSMRQKEFSVP